MSAGNTPQKGRKSVLHLALVALALVAIVALITANAIRRHRKLQEFSPVFTDTPADTPMPPPPPQVKQSTFKFPPASQP